MALFTAIADEFKLNDTNVTVETITNPDVGVLDNGTFVVVWEEPFNGNLNDIDIRGRRFSSDGTPLGDSFVVSDGNGNETQPAIAVTSEGRSVVTYVKNDDIFFRIFDINGLDVSGEILVSDFQQSKKQFDPDITIDPEGDFTIVWTHEFEENDSDIRGRLFETDGTPITNDIAIADSENNESQASLAAIPVANNSNNSDQVATIVTFTSDLNGNEDIFFTLYGNDGNELVSPTNAVSNSNVGQNQRDSSVAIDNNGNFVISWTNEFSDVDEDVVIRRFSADGTPLDNLEIPVASETGNQNDSEIALAEDGTIVVAYEDDVNDNVRFRQFDSAGEPITDTETYDVNANVENNPALAIGGNTLVITADDDRTHTFDPYGRVFTEPGSNNNSSALFIPIAEKFKVNTSEIRNIANPDVGVASNGNFVVVWQEPFEGNAANDIDIRFRRFSANGTPLDQNDLNAAFSSANETQAAVAVDPNGNFVVTYVKDNDIFVRLFAADGNPRGNEILVSTFEQNKEQFAPDIAIDSEGDFTVVWTHQFATNDSDIRARLFNADGTPITDDIAIADSDGNESQASLAATPVANNGTSSDAIASVITFTSDINGNEDIFYTLYGNQGNQLVAPTNAVSNDNLSFNQRESSVAIDSNGNFVISWANEFASGDEDVVIRRFSSNTSPLDDREIAIDDGTGNQNNPQIALADEGNIVVAYEDEASSILEYRQLNANGEALTDSIPYGVNSGVQTNPALAIGGNNVVITGDDEQNNSSNPYARVLQNTVLDDPLIRFQNTALPGTYLFAGATEAQSVRNNFVPPFVEEGVAFNVSAGQNDDLVRFNRFQSIQVPGTYLYVNEQESISVRNNFSNDFREEGTAFYALGADENLGADVFRFRNTNNNTYIFVLAGEAQSIRDNFSDVFIEEGIAFEVG